MGGRVWQQVGLGLLCAMLMASAANAGRKHQRTALPPELTLAEQQSLLAGFLVSRPMRFEQQGGHYVGGLSYLIVDCSAQQVRSVLDRPSSFRHFLPNTKNVRVSTSHQLELVQGNELVQATYTVKLHRREDDNELRFWLDPGEPHDIRDVWGYFRVSPFGSSQSLVTVAVALDIGPGIARLLFEDIIQELILSTPRYLDDYLAELAASS